MTSLVSAQTIGDLYQQAHSSHTESVERLIKAGELLSSIKDSLAHGDWEIWLFENKVALGFCDRTARRLIQAYKLSTAKRTLVSDLKPDQALEISRKVWNHLPAVPETDDTRTAAFKQISRVFEWMARHPADEVAKELFYAEAAEVRQKVIDALEWLAWLERHTRKTGKLIEGRAPVAAQI